MPLSLPGAGRALAALTLAFAAQGELPASAQLIGTPTKLPISAVRADRAIAMPTTGAFGFEIPFATIPTPPPVPPYAQWGPWKAFGTSGIAQNGTPLLGGLTAPFGTRVGYVTGTGLLRCSYAFSPGIWRLRYRAADRSQGGVADGQVCGSRSAESRSRRPPTTRPSRAS